MRGCFYVLILMVLVSLSGCIGEQEKPQVSKSPAPTATPSLIVLNSLKVEKAYAWIETKDIGTNNPDYFYRVLIPSLKIKFSYDASGQDQNRNIEFRTTVYRKYILTDETPPYPKHTEIRIEDIKSSCRNVLDKQVDIILQGKSLTSGGETEWMKRESDVYIHASVIDSRNRVKIGDKWYTSSIDEFSGITPGTKEFKEIYLKEISDPRNSEDKDMENSEFVETTPTVC